MVQIEEAELVSLPWGIGPEILLLNNTLLHHFFK